VSVQGIASFWARAQRASATVRGFALAAMLAGIALLAGLASLTTGPSARAATASVDVQIVAPGQPGTGFEELDTTTFAAAEAQILALDDGTGIAVAWPDVDPANPLNAFPLEPPR